MKRYFAILLASTLAAQTPSAWTVARNSHFEVYSHSAGQSAATALQWFENLRSFFLQNGMPGAAFDDSAQPPVSVVIFQSQKEYDEYRLRPVADAYYVALGKKNFIVLSTLATASHEYAHYVLQSSGLKLAPCLNEGLAEFFSSLRFNGKELEIGGDLPARTQVLRKNKLLPLAELFDLRSPDSRKDAELFYSESWALVNMLTSSNSYAALLPQLLTKLNSGANASQAFSAVYAKSLHQVEQDLQMSLHPKWMARTVPARLVELEPPTVSYLSAREVNNLLARISLVSGRLQQARVRYEQILIDTPGDPDIAAALGDIAERQGNHKAALEYWGRAVENKTTDAELCYRFALSAEASQSIRQALERAVNLDPGFDDARYKLGLAYSQAGEFKLAVAQLKAMRLPTGARRYGYWLALAAALNELDERQGAIEAAQKAAAAATTDEERGDARRLMYMAQTDLTVQFSTDSAGHSQMITARVPHGTNNWNPFVEPSDRMQHVTGKLTEVLCSAGKLTGFLMHTSDGQITLDVPDPMHVLIRNGPGEFYCGPTPERPIQADYAVVNASGATANILRGATFQ